LDTCDPKPNAPAEYRGPYSVIPTRTPGVHFSELLPQLAQRSHRFNLIRTHVTSNSAHPQGGSVALTGFEEGPVLHPNFGSIVARARAQSAPDARGGSLPPFVSLARGPLADSTTPIRGFGGATLGARHDPFMVGCSERGEVNIPA